MIRRSSRIVKSPALRWTLGCAVVPVVVSVALADDPCYKILNDNDWCVEEEIHGPPLSGCIGWTWVVYPTSKTECKNMFEFNGQGMTECSDTSATTFHPQRIHYYCSAGLAREGHNDDYTQITCPVPEYPATAQNCTAEGTGG